MSALSLRDVLGERRFEGGEFPLTIGGTGCAIVLANAPAGVMAYLALQDEQLFLQPEGAAAILLNGAQVANSTWLREGDVLDMAGARLKLSGREGRRILEVADTAQANLTAPPIINTIAATTGSEAEPLTAIQFRAQSQTVGRPRRTLPVGRIAIAVASVLLIGVLWFVFSATSLLVTVEPSQARVQISGPWPRLGIGAQFLLRPGEYRVYASAPGHEDAVRTVRVTDASDQRVTLQLRKLPGRLEIATPAAVQVRVDGNPRGTAPGVFELSAGEHRIELLSERYLPFRTEVDVTGAGKKQRLAPQLVPNWADVTVISEPGGAAVLIAGEKRGATPLKLELLAGNHPLELRLQGYAPWSTDVQVRANEPLTLGPIRLGLPDGRLQVQSRPQGASVTVAGIYRGVAPLSLQLRPEISHSVVLTRPGYQSATQIVTLKPGEKRTLDVPLAGIYGEVNVRAEPADAQLFIDGAARGAANQSLKLVTAPHTIEVRKPGYATFKTTVTPREGLPQVVEARLVTEAQSHFAGLPATLRTKVGIELKLMPIGRFTMGSARREPGRRANEAQREVELRRPFYLGVHEVTNEQFRAFRDSHKAGFVGQHSLDLDRQPAVNIAWRDAAAFCNWLSEQEGLPKAYEEKNGSLALITPVNTGYRLPTEAEWEWAARHTRSKELLRYPWGDSLPIPTDAGNFADRSARLIVQEVRPEYEDPYPASAPIGKFAASVLGLFDMGGNAAEWTHDYYVISMDAGQELVDPLGPAKGKSHVIRGSSWRHSSVTDLRLAARDFGEGGRPDLGFRIARYAQEVKP